MAEKWQIVLAIISATWAGWVISAAIGAWKQRREDETGDGAGLRYLVKKLERSFEEFQEATEKRFDRAGRETSDAYSYMQGMETKCLKDFAPKDITDERFAENLRQHDQFRTDLARLERRRLRR